jgi:hypothetical protein
MSAKYATVEERYRYLPKKSLQSDFLLTIVPVFAVEGESSLMFLCNSNTSWDEPKTFYVLMFLYLTLGWLEGLV